MPSRRPGRIALHAWLATPVANPRDLRAEFLAKVYLGRVTGAPETPELLLGQRIVLQQRLDRLKQSAERSGFERMSTRFGHFRRRQLCSGSRSWRLPNSRRGLCHGPRARRRRRAAGRTKTAKMKHGAESEHDPDSPGANAAVDPRHQCPRRLCAALRSAGPDRFDDAHGLRRRLADQCLRGPGKGVRGHTPPSMS